MRRLFIFIIILGVATNAPFCTEAVLDDAGTNNPFELGAGSRALAMSGAFVAVADDVTAIFWNPGGLAQLEQIELSAMHINLFFDTPYDFFGIAYPILDWGTFSIGAVRIATKGVVLRDERSRLIGDREGSLDMREYVIGYSRDVLWNIQAGLAVKIDQQRLLGDFDTGVGLDLGLHYHFPEGFLGVSTFDWGNLNLGLTFQNLLGSQLRLGKITDVLPLHVKAGLAYRYHIRGSLKQQILISTAWQKSTWRSSQFLVGLEYHLLDLLAIRGGISSSAWTAGGGLHYAGVFLDYALASEELGLTHRFSLSYRFGIPISEQRIQREKRHQLELDRKAQARAQAAVEKIKRKMEAAMKAAERRHRQEKRVMLAKQKQLLNAERQRQLKQRERAVADEYFKAFHYFQGIKDYMAKNYKQALVELETVKKYDPNYLELQLYLARTRQRIKGQVKFMSEKNFQLYYQGIDFYVANEFEKAIQVWEKIRESEPNNVLVLRNIDEAQERIAKLKAVKRLINQEESRERLSGEEQQANPEEVKPGR